jgi:hypothetical protein
MRHMKWTSGINRSEVQYLFLSQSQCYLYQEICKLLFTEGGYLAVILQLFITVISGNVVKLFIQMTHRRKHAYVFSQSTISHEHKLFHP